MERARLLAVFSVTRLTHAQGEITALFEREGIDYVPLKGAALRELWPEPWMRTSCDLDILVREEDMARARDALCAHLGYVQRSVGFRDVSLYSPSDVHLELHFSLRDTADRCPPLRAAWEYAERVGESRAHRLRPDFHILYLLSHLLGHIGSGGGGIRPVLDLALLCRAPHDTAALDALLAECRLSRFGEAVTALGNAILDGGEVNGAPAALLDWLIGGETYGEMHRRAEVKRAKGSTAASRRTRRRYVLSRLFPPRRELALIYPSLARHAWLYPLCALRRLLRLLFGGRLGIALRRKRAEREMRVVSTESADALFSALGLREE
jgi:hypothetical protein